MGSVVGRIATLAVTLLVAACAPTGVTAPSATASMPAPSLSSRALSPAPTSSAVSSVVPATASPAPTSTPVPSPPADLLRAVEAERDGIRVRVELQRNPLPAGEPSWVDVTVTNRGKDDVTWFHDGCAHLASVHGKSQVAWSKGVPQQPKLLAFRTYALGGHLRKEAAAYAWLDFVKKERLHRGPPGCTDMGISETVKPGRSVRQRLWWSGYSSGNWALPPTGPATISAFAAYYWRGENEPESIPDQSIELRLEAWVVNRRPAQLSPAEVVDAALADPAFVAYLDTQKLGNGREEIAWYLPDRNAWEIGVMPWYESDPPRIHGVLVDAVTGRILGPLDRPWDEKVDHFP